MTKRFVKKYFIKPNPERSILIFLIISKVSLSALYSSMESLVFAASSNNLAGVSIMEGASLISPSTMSSISLIS